MLLVLDRDDCLYLFPSIAEAEAHLETIDIEGDEYQFCDESGQPYVGEVLTPVGRWSGGAFRIVPKGTPDATSPGSFLARTKHFSSSVPQLKTLEDAYRQLVSSKA